MKVIFLDIDGVLLTPESYQNKSYGAWLGLSPAEECAKQLNLLTEETGAVIVVSSAWRLGQDRDDLELMLREWGITAPVIDRTPYFPSEIRGIEIQHWLCKQAEEEVEGLVILDDDEDMGPMMPWLVKTNFADGLTEADRLEAMRIINSAERPNMTRSEAAWESIREAMSF